MITDTHMSYSDLDRYFREDQKNSKFLLKLK